MSTVPRIRIRLKAYDHKLLDQSVTDIIDTVRTTGARIVGAPPFAAAGAGALAAAGA